MLLLLLMMIIIIIILMLLQLLPPVQDEARDAAVAAMAQAAFESVAHMGLQDGFCSSVATSGISSSSISSSSSSCSNSSSSSDAILIMSMVATDALMQVHSN